MIFDLLNKCVDHVDFFTKRKILRNSFRKKIRNEIFNGVDIELILSIQK